MKTLISYLIQPIPTLIVLILAGFLFYLKGRRKISRYLLMLASVYLVLVTTPFFSEPLLQRLERQYPVYDASQSAPYVLVLGSGTNFDPKRPPTQQLGETALVRLTEGIRIYQMLQGSKLVLSAGKRNQPKTQAEVTGAAAVSLGVPPGDTLMLNTPMTTQEEAEAFVHRFGKGTSLILVTSARHLPRAMYLFREVGLHPIAAPTDFKIGKDYGQPWTSYLPGIGSLKKSELVIHEYVGMLWARMMN